MSDTPNTIEVSREYCEEIGAMIIALVSTHLRRMGGANADSLIEEAEEAVASQVSATYARGLWADLGIFALKTAGLPPLMCELLIKMDWRPVAGRRERGHTTGLEPSECQLFAHHLGEIAAAFYRLAGAPPGVTEEMKNNVKEFGERECAQKLLIFMLALALEQLGASDELLDSLADSACEDLLSSIKVASTTAGEARKEGSA